MCIFELWRLPPVFVLSVSFSSLSFCLLASLQKLRSFKKDSHSDVEAEQVADHSRHSGQDDHSGDVVDQRVHGQTEQSEWSIQLLWKYRGNMVLFKLVNMGTHSLRQK